MSPSTQGYRIQIKLNQLFRVFSASHPKFSCCTPKFSASVSRTYHKYSTHSYNTQSLSIVAWKFLCAEKYATRNYEQCHKETFHLYRNRTMATTMGNNYNKKRNNNSKDLQQLLSDKRRLWTNFCMNYSAVSWRSGEWRPVPRPPNHVELSNALIDEHVMNLWHW